MTGMILPLFERMCQYEVRYSNCRNIYCLAYRRLCRYY